MSIDEAYYAIFSGIETNETIKMGEQPYFEVMEQAEKALEKRIVKKAKRKGNYWWICPSCNHDLKDCRDKEYCEFCGQRVELLSKEADSK